MYRFLAILCCALAALAAAPVCAAEPVARPKPMPLKPEVLYEKYSGAVVSIEMQSDDKKASGTGFLWTAGEVVTNFHVVAGAEAIVVEMANGRKFGVDGIVWADRERDLAVLSLEGEHFDDELKPTHPIAGVPEFQFSPKIGSTIYVIGDPRGLKRSISNGLIGGVRAFHSLHKVYQITAPISPGNSGSPVFNEYGAVIGVVTSMLTNAQNVNFCVPSSYITPARHREKMPLAEWAEHSRAGAGQEAAKAPVPEPVSELLKKLEFDALAMRGLRSANVIANELGPDISDIVVRSELTDLIVGRMRANLEGFKVSGPETKPDDPRGAGKYPDCTILIALNPLRIPGGRVVSVTLSVYRWMTPANLEPGVGVALVDSGKSPAPVWSDSYLLTGTITDLDERIKNAIRSMVDKLAKDVELGKGAVKGE